MNRFIVLLAAVVFFSPVTAQQTFKEYTQSSHAVIKSISSDTSYSGFSALDKAIGDKRVVMLGEQDHGDAATFIAKTKIIKYLHEKKGFNIIAFESDFFALTRGQEEIMNDSARFRKYLQSNIFPIWTYCDACADLFYRYLPARFVSASPVTVTGFDCQPHGGYTKRKLRSYLDSILSKEEWLLPEYSLLKKEVLDWTDTLVMNYGKGYKNKKQLEGFDNNMQQVMAEWLKKKGADYNYLLLTSIRAFYNQVATEGYIPSSEIRDEQMAANLNWLVNEKYKNEKIIVWAANEHIMKNSKETMSGLYTTMGTHFCRMPGNEAQTYILGFTSGTGTAGRITIANSEYKLRRPDKDSYENWFEKNDFTFTDFITYNNTVSEPESFKMKAVNHYWSGNRKWTNSFDGIFYIRRMYACKPVK